MTTKEESDPSFKLVLRIFVEFRLPDVKNTTHVVALHLCLVRVCVFPATTYTRIFSSPPTTAPQWPLESHPNRSSVRSKLR